MSRTCDRADASWQTAPKTLTKTFMGPVPRVEERRAEMHAIKNDLGVIQSVLALVDRELSAQSRERIARASDALQRVTALLAPRSGVARATHERAEASCAVRLLQEVVDELAPRAETIGARIVVSVRAQGRRVGSSLREALVNLVGNALEASGREDVVSVSVEVTLDGDVLYEVRDQGHGIAPEILALLGVRETTTRRGGSGLGVLLACESVQSLGGVLRFETAPSAGTTVMVLVPSV